MIQILKTDSKNEVARIMREIAVDPYGIKIMLPKAITHLVRMNAVSNITANILKQEMLSLGGDVAVSRGALTGKAKKTGCLLMGNLSQFNRLSQKLTRQPFGLSEIAAALSCAITNYEKDRFKLNLGRYRLSLGNRSCLMAILNLTPDSFSGDGLLSKSQIPNPKSQIDDILRYVEGLIRDGADIIDVGGESSRPGARAVSLKDELSRVIPVIRALANKIKIPISVDTYKPEVARQALDNGACIVNDICGLRNARMSKVVARHKAAVVIMHMQGKPRTMQKNPVYKSLIDEVIEYLQHAIRRGRDCGIREENIIVDPGIGFGKTAGHNLEILKRLSEFRVLGRPIMVGTSRKSFIGKILNAGPKERIFGSLASCVLAVHNGAHIVRVHDVKAVREALKVLDAVRISKPCTS
jgi:dihydropteroate synthase